jgi:hypothetical protein
MAAGDVTSRSLGFGNEMPANTADTFYVQIGSYSTVDEKLTVQNSRYGPIDATICRNWFSSEAPYFGVTFYAPLL